jgi:hypothetical protein
MAELEVDGLENLAVKRLRVDGDLCGLERRFGVVKLWGCGLRPPLRFVQGRGNTSGAKQARLPARPKIG